MITYTIKVIATVIQVILTASLLGYALSMESKLNYVLVIYMTLITGIMWL